MITTLQYTIFSYLLITVLYCLVFSISSRFFKPWRRLKIHNTSKSKFAVLIPAYKEDEVIYDTAKNALNQDYQKEQFDIFVIADSLSDRTIKNLKTLSIKVIEVSFKKSTKAKAINKTLSLLKDSYDHVLILDADNIMDKNFIRNINQYLSNGFSAVQGRRVAKNLNTKFSILDAISEEINNSIFRNGHFNLGLSSGLIGSGMAFERKLFKRIMGTINAVSGFDKELELKLLKENIKIAYAKEAVLYDEKVENSEIFLKQRRRWLTAQFFYFKKHIIPSLKELILKKNINYFNKAFQMFLPPRIILIGCIALNILSYPLFNPSPGVVYWITLFFITCFSFYLSTSKSYLTVKTFKALFLLPSAFFNMILALLTLKGANKNFIHTPHKNFNSDKGDYHENRDRSSKDF